MDVLFIINGSAYGQDATYNGLRLAVALARRGNVTVRVFLMGDGVTAAMAGQKAPEGYYHLDRILGVVAQHGGEVGCCGTCMDARGMTGAMLTGAARRSTMDELADWTVSAGKVLVF